MPELPTADVLAATRHSLHQVAEHVVSAARKRATGHIGLRPSPGGFSTPPFDDGHVVAVDGVDIVVISDAGERRAPLTTVRAAAELVGIEPGFPWTKHPPATELAPDAELTVDPDAARVLADWFALGDEALGRLAAELAEDEPSAPQIYPEHFDLAISAAAVNYGASPGDQHVETPYVYVGPHDGPPTSDDYWNAPFGAYRTIHEIRTADDAVAFFRDGRQRVLAATSTSRSSS